MRSDVSGGADSRQRKIEHWPKPLGEGKLFCVSSRPETDLLARCQEGDPEAWNQLFELHYGPASRFIFQLSPDFTAEDTEEICQETFLTVVRSLALFRGQCRFQTWLFRIAGNKARDYLQRRQALKRGRGITLTSLDQEHSETGLPPDPPSPSASPDLELISAERMSLVRQALDEVGDSCREIIELRYFGELSYDDIALGLKMNPKTVSSRLSKCLGRLEKIVRLHLAREESRSYSV